MTDSDILIIGGGILGCFLARSLRRYDLSVTVLEKENDVCRGISRGGSGIIYAGYDMKPGTRKARMTVQACRNFPALCRTLGIKYRNCGSLMVSFGPDGDQSLKEKLHRGTANGVPGIRLLDREECLRREPVLSPEITLGLYAPGTCTVNPWELCLAAYENACANGAAFLFDTECTGIRRIPGGFCVTAGAREYTCRILVNCAGAGADRVHEMLSAPSVRIRPESADYIILEEDAAPVPRHVIFHEPEGRKKGLTLIPSADGNTVIGQTERPGAAPGDPTEAAGIDWLRSLCGTVAPPVPHSRIMRTFAVTRPNPYSVTFADGEWIAENKGHFDFSILEEDGFFSLIGVKTPGLTCSPELAEDMTGKILAFLGEARENPDYDPVRERPAAVHRLDPEERARLIEKDPAYGRIICTCRDISEGEIRDAIRRGARTPADVKYRTGIMMGKCQGSRCLMDLLDILPFP